MFSSSLHQHVQEVLANSRQQHLHVRHGSDKRDKTDTNDHAVTSNWAAAKGV